MKVHHFICASRLILWRPVLACELAHVEDACDARRQRLESVLADGAQTPRMLEMQQALGQDR